LPPKPLSSGPSAPAHLHALGNGGLTDEELLGLLRHLRDRDVDVVAVHAD
jgi:hypothetical protein